MVGRLKKRTAGMTPDQQQVEDLLTAGRIAYEAGRDQQAYDCWRRAAALDPKNEAVWLSLAKVVTTSEDRRACLENALAINPKNTDARNELYLYDLLEARTNPGKARLRDKRKQKKRRQRLRMAPLVARVLLVMVLIISLLLLAAALQLLAALL
ncbi:MAG: hypothetical protein OHK0046_09470 [Anaerolineae bacterium]